MKAMILAAGKGTRVRPITHEIPKPMIPILRKPVMESIIELLREHSADEIVVNTSHLASVIENYFRDGEQFGVQIAYSYEGVLTDKGLEGDALGSAGGMKRIQDFSGFFDDSFIVLCGDAWIDLDITEAVRMHKEKGGIASIILQEVPHEEVHKYGVVDLHDDGRIKQFQEKPAPEDAISNLINTGIYIFEPEIFDHIPANTEYDIGGELFPKLVEKGIAFHGFKMDFQWVDIGSVPDVWSATRKALNGEVRGYKMPGREVRPGVWTGLNVAIDWDNVDITGPVYIGSSTRIDAGTKITGPCMIGSNCIIEGAAELDDCIISDYTRVGGLARVHQKIVFGKHCISLDGEPLDIEATKFRWLLDDARRNNMSAPELHDMLTLNDVLPHQDSSQDNSRNKASRQEVCEVV